MLPPELRPLDCGRLAVGEEDRCRTIEGDILTEDGAERS
jgi:hypothetical protein